MAAPVYLIVQMKITDREMFGERYAAPLMPQLLEHGVEILAVDPAATVVEGAYGKNSTVILRFPSREIFDVWYGSDAYQPLKTVRAELSDASETLMLLVDGFDPSAA
ncbi:MAG: DUF1330 domain-containing protein [Pseudomonadota bacterium]